MIKPVLVALFLFVFLSSHSEEYVIHLDKKPAEFHLEDYYISEIKVNLYDSSYIGRVYTGKADVRDVAKMGISVRDELYNFFRNNGLMEPSGKPLLLRVNRLFIYESKVSTGIAGLNFSFIEKKGDKYVELFQGCGFIEKNIPDVTPYHSENIVNLISRVINDFSARMKEGKTRPVVVTDLNDDPLLKKENYEIFRKGIKPGAYHSFYDLRDGFPDTTTQFMVDYATSRKDTVFASLESVNPKDELPYAFCDGTNCYILSERRYFPVKAVNGMLVCIHHPDWGNHGMSEESISAVAVSGILFGAIGGGIAGDATAGNGDLTGSNGLYVLDFTTTTLLPEWFERSMKVCSRSIFFLSESTLKDYTVDIYTGDILRATLEKGNFYEFPARPATSEITIMVRGKNGLIGEKVIHPEAFYTDVYLLRVKSDKILITQVFDNTKTDILKKKNPENTVQGK